MPDKRQKALTGVYNALQSKGVTNLGTQEEFAKRMENVNNRKKVYDALRGFGFSNVGSYEEYEARFAMPETTNTETTEAPAAPIDATVTPAEQARQAAEGRALFDAYRGKPDVSTLEQAPEKANPAEPKPTPQPAQRAETKPVQHKAPAPTFEPVNLPYNGEFKPEQQAPQVTVPEAPENAEQMQAEYLRQREIDKYALGRKDDVDEAIEIGRQMEAIAPALGEYEGKTSEIQEKYGDFLNGLKKTEDGKLIISNKADEKKFNEYISEIKPYVDAQEEFQRLLDTPAGKEYAELYAQLTPLLEEAKSDHTAELDLKIANVEAQLAHNPIYRALAGENAPSESEINYNLLRANHDVIKERINMATLGSVRRELRKQDKAIKDDILNNKHFQDNVRKELIQTEKALREAEDFLSERLASHTGPSESLLGDQEYVFRMYEATNLRQKRTKLEHLRDNNTNDFFVNMADVFGDPDFLTQGIHGLSSIIQTKLASKSPESAGARELLKSVVGKQQAEELEGDFVNWVGRAGQITANMIPFMVTIGMVDGWDNIAKAVETRAEKWAYGKMTEEAAKKLGNRFLVHTLGTTLGDVAAGIVSANTIGLGNTAKNAMERYYGTLMEGPDGKFGYYHQDKNGKLVEGGESFIPALLKAETSQSIEYWSERFGDHLQHLVGKGALRLGHKKGFENAAEIFGKAHGVDWKDIGLSRIEKEGLKSSFEKVLKAATETASRFGIQGYPYEVIEEEVNIIANAIFTGDNKISDLWDHDTQVDIWGGMLFSIGAMQGVSLGYNGIVEGLSALARNKYYKELESRLRDVSAYGAVTIDGWRNIEEEINNSSNKDIPGLISKYLNSGEYAPEQIETIRDYIGTTYVYRGFNNGTLEFAKERLSSENPLSSLNINETVSFAETEIGDAYMLGYQSNEKDAEMIESALKNQKERMLEMFGVEDMPREQALAIVNNAEATAEQKDAALDYLMASASAEGMADQKRAKHNAIKAQVSARLTKAYGGRVYRQSPDGQRIVESAYIDGENGQPTMVFFPSDETIVTSSASGNVQTTTGMKYYRGIDGKPGTVLREQVYTLDEAGNKIVGQTMVTDYDSFLDGLAHEEEVHQARQEEEAEVERRVQEETAEVAAQQPTEAEVQSAENLIGTDCTISINGQMSTVHVTEVGDGMVLYTYEDAEGNEKPGALPIRSFETAMNGGLLTEDYNPVSAETEQPQQAATTETSQPVLPTTKDGRVDWKNMFNVDEQVFSQRIPELAKQMESLYGDKAYSRAQSWLKASQKAAEEDTGDPAKDAENAEKARNYAALLNAMTPAAAPAQTQTTENKAGKQEKKAEKKPTKTVKVVKKREGGRFGDKLDNLGDYIGFEDYVERTLLREMDENRMRWKSSDDGVHKGLGALLGLKGGTTETTSRAWLLGKEGRWPQEFADELLSEYAGSMGIEPEDISNGDAMYALNTLLDIIYRFPSYKSMYEDVAKQHSLSNTDQEFEAYIENEIGKAAAEEGLTPEEFLDKEDYLNERAKEYAEHYDEISAIFVEQYLEEEQRRLQEVRRPVAEQQGAEAGPAGSSDVVPTEQENPVSTGRGNRGNAGAEAEGNVSSPGAVHQPSVQSAESQPVASNYGASNKVVTTTDYEEAKRNLLNKLKGQLNSGIDPEVLAAAIQVAAYHIEAGARKFADFCKAVINDIGEAIRPYLKAMYEGARWYPGMDEISKDMSPQSEVASADVNTIGKEEEAIPAEEAVEEAPQGTEVPAPETTYKVGDTVIFWNDTRTGKKQGKIVKVKPHPEFGTHYDVESTLTTENKPGSAERFTTRPHTYVVSEQDILLKTESAKSAESQNNSVSSQENEARKEFSETVANRLVEACMTGEKPYKSITDLRKEAREAGMDVDERGKDDILLQELVEVAIVDAARYIMSEEGGLTSREAFDAICQLYNMQPTLGQRSSDKVKMQQYSTPLPLSFVAQMFAYKPSTQSVLEPTAGNGMLVFGIPADKVHANELDQTRHDNLKGQGYRKVTQNDATEPFNGDYDAIIANPPFGAHEAVNFDGKDITGLDPLISIRALDAMKDDGRAAIIIGGTPEFADNGAWKTKKPFFSYLYDHYNVKGVVPISGNLYQKQGTTYPTMMILIDGRRSDEERAQAKVYPPVKENAVPMANTQEELYNTVNDILNDNRKTNGSNVTTLQPEGARQSLNGVEQTGDLFAGDSSVELDENGANGRGRNNERGQGVRGTGRNAVSGENAQGAQPGITTTGQRQGAVRNVPGERPGTTERAGNGTRSEGVPGAVSGRESNAGESARATDGRTGRESSAPVPDGKSSLRKPVRVEKEKRSTEDKNLSYVQHSGGNSLESVAPAAMVEAMDEALSKIESEVGKSIDEFVMDELGYKSGEELYNALAAEQIDSVAMAIYNMKHGGAMIIGDQTGVGKGRQVAALIRWARRHGKKPIFMTQKASLFSDIYRDMVAVGSGDLKPLIINAEKKERDKDDPTGKKLHHSDQSGVMLKEDANGNLVEVYKSPSPAKLKEIIKTGKVPAGYDYVVLTYSQLGSGDSESNKAAGKNLVITKANDYKVKKADFIRKIAQDNYAILDESHTAAGKDSNSGAFLQSIIPSVDGVTFSSATFAKTPETMPLYAIKSAISQANVEPKELIEMIRRGGVTLQEIMSRALTGSGQMVRRERDMSDVKTDWKTIDDPETAKRARENYDKAIKIFNDIIEFQHRYIDSFIAEKGAELAMMMETTERTRGTENFGIDNPSFVSQTYNFTKQLMLALKADAIVNEAVKEIEAGRHPVIALENTYESGIKAYDVGDKITDTSFSAGLLRSLERIMQYTVKDEDGKPTTTSIKPSQLGAAGESAYHKLQEQIREATKDIFLSPLDAIKEKLNEKGYKVGEVTGRKTQVVKGEDGYELRDRQADAKQAVADFNSGKTDVIIINKAGSTGISLHASKLFNDKRQRSMIIAQPLGDINDYMQMIGRIDRTGQVHRGYYINLSLPVPAETRFNMMLAAKLKSLNANTTTSQESDASSVEAPDFLNKYGSQVIVEYLRDNPTLFEKLVDETELKLGDGQNHPSIIQDLDEYIASEDDAKKVTGRVALFPVVEQEAFYNDISERYNALIKYLDETGENTLKITTLPLRAKTLARKVGTEGKDPNGSNPFAQNSYVERVEVDVLKKPMKADDIRKARENLLDGKTPEQRRKELLDRVEAQRKEKLAAENQRFENKKEKTEKELEKQIAAIRGRNVPEADKVAEINRIKNKGKMQEVEEEHERNVASIESQHNKLRERFEQFNYRDTYLIHETLIGATLYEGAGVPSLFLGYKTAKEGDNLTPSTSFAVFATHDGRRRLEIKFTDGAILDEIDSYSLLNWHTAQQTSLENWDSSISNAAREERYMLTGNILQAWSDATQNGMLPGRLVSYTDIDGNIKDGILMNSTWQANQLRSAGAPINTARERLDQMSRGETLESVDHQVELFKTWNGYDLRVPKSKKDGAKYWQDAKLLSLVRTGKFYQSRGMFEGEVPEANLPAVLNRLTDLGVRIQTEDTGNWEKVGEGTPRTGVSTLAEQSNSKGAERTYSPSVTVNHDEYQAKLNDIVSRIKAVQENSKERKELVKQQEKLLSDYIDAIDPNHIQVDFRSYDELEDYFLSIGMSAAGAKYNAELMRDNDAYGCYYMGRIIMVNEKNSELDKLRDQYAHERQHYINESTGLDKKLFDKVGGDVNMLEKALVPFVGPSHAASYRFNYRNKLEYMADEVIAYAMGLAYSDPAFANNQKFLQLAQEIQDFINELVDEQFNDSYRPAIQGRRYGNINVGAGSRSSLQTPESSSGEVSEGSRRSDESAEGYQTPRFGLETDPAVLEQLESGNTLRVFRAMQLIDGKLYPPMSAKVDGKLREPIELGKWEKAEEQPELADDKGNFTLNKGNGTSLKAKYNPYFHTSRSPLNDQFTSAYDRPNLVTVEVEVPESELTSGYRADKAKDAVGEMTWHSGPVSGKLPEGKKRKVILSRWDKPVRIVPDSEVAWNIAKMLEGENIAIPYNVITPGLRAELEKVGVPVSGEPSGTVKSDNLRFRDAYHGTKADFAEFDLSHALQGEGAMAHGYGHYVSLSKDVARDYAKRIGGSDWEVASAKRRLEYERRYAELEYKKNGLIGRLLNREVYNNTLADIARRESSLQDKRHLYTVEIPDDNGSNYLDEQKELSMEERKRIADALRALPDEAWKNNDEELFGEPTKNGLANSLSRRLLNGYEMYAELNHGLGSKKAASDFLHSIGYVGIKYDGRRDGPCAVIFSDDDIKIAEHEKFREGLDVERRINEAEMEGINNMLGTMENELGIHIRRVTRAEMPKSHESDKGYYNTESGAVYVCMDNVTDMRDAMATVCHEIVGHKGLRKLFGDRFNNAMVRIYAALDGKGRAWVSEYMVRHNLKPGDTDAIILGVEEYLSSLAESENFKSSLWERIKQIFNSIVNAIFKTRGFTFTDRELNYILRASYEHMKNPNWLNTISGKAANFAMKRELGINETDPYLPTDPEGPLAGDLFRGVDTGVANADYDTEMRDWLNTAIMEHQNSDLPVKIGMDKIMQEVGKKKVSEDEDYLTRHNLASSRAETQAHEFELFYFKPMLEQVRKVRDMLTGSGKSSSDREKAYEKVLDYLYAVSGLERNAYKNAEIEQAKQDALVAARDAAEELKKQVRLSAKMPAEIVADLDAIDKQLKKDEKAIDKRYENMKKDWSGLTSLMGRPAEEWREAEDDARAMIGDFQNQVGNSGAIDDLWNAIRKCTDYSLEHAYKHGLLTREEYERLHGTASQPRMWEYYLPLRGFDQETAEEEFNYTNLVHPKSNSVVVKKMNGRWTQADNPLANILNIAETEIVQGNDNWAKQALYRFVLDAGKNSLLSQRTAWFVKDPASGTWSLAQPYDGESFEAFEARMQALHDNIQPDGTQGKPLAKMGRQGLKLDKIMANKGHQNEHLIRLKVGGVEKMIWVNGNPAIAKAVSGIGRAQNLQMIRRASRALSNLFTTYSLDFTARNLMRDTIYSRLALIAKEDNAYREQYRKNWWNNFGYGAFAFPMIRMMSMWDKGTLQTKSNPTEKERMFMDFMRDGGQTGYTIINSVDEIKKSIERSMRRAGDKTGTVQIPIIGHYAKFVKTLNEAFELLTRFTAYQTSRDMGRSGQRSAADAKEISVNFNRKGAQSGQGIWGGMAAYLGATHYFYNAGVQGFDNFLHLFKVAPVKMSTAAGVIVLLGMMQPIINAMIAGLAAGMGDGDDKDKDIDPDWYWNLPEWVRRNNIVIGTGESYIAIPLAVELRAFYGLGDIAASLMFHKQAARDGFAVGLDVINTAAEILPVNPVEGYSTANRNIGDAVLRTVFPDAGMFIVDIATNRDYTGRPLWKENPFAETTSKAQSAYASTPKALVDACQELSKLTYGGIDIPPGAVRDVFKNLGGGFYKAAEDASKIVTGIRGIDPERPFRYDDIPFFSGFTGHIDEDRSNSFVSNALYDYKKNCDDVVRRINAVTGEKVSPSMVYDHPEDLPAGARTQRILEGEKYVLGKMYREGMNNKYKMKQYLTGPKVGQWHESKEIERKGVETYRKEWQALRDKWVKGEATELDVENAWHAYYNAQADLVDRLMNEEYDHVQEKMKNGIPYEPKPSLSERAYKAVKDLVD